MTYKTEEDYIDEIEVCLKLNNFETWREVIPDQCKKWNMPLRVDLIFYRSDIGYIGVEAKNIRSLRNGGVIAKAIQQINKYRNLTYFEGVKIKRWALTFPTSKDDYYDAVDKNFMNNIMTFLLYFLQVYETDLLYYSSNENNNTFDRIAISPNTKKALHIRKRVTLNNGWEND